MKKLLFLGIAASLLAAGCNSSQPSAQNSQSQNSVARQSPAVPANPSAAQSVPAGGQQTVASVNTNVGSVAGVNLGELAAEANQSTSMSEQDGASDAQAMVSDGVSINSSTDSVNNPVQ